MPATEIPNLAEEVDAYIGANLKAHREKMGLSQLELAALLTDAGLKGFHQTTIARIEKGDRALRAAEALAIGRVLETSLEELAESGYTARVREQISEINDAGNLLMKTTKSLVSARMRAARLLDEMFSEEVTLRSALATQSKANISPLVIDLLEDVYELTDPESVFCRAISEVFAEFENMPRYDHEVIQGSRESITFKTLKKLASRSGDQPEEPAE